MDLYNTIIVTIWLTVIYAIWAATAAGDPGYGQAAFLIAAIAGHLFLRKLKSERPIRKDEGIKIPDQIDYDIFSGLSNEVKSKLKSIRPKPLGQALRIDGVTPAAAIILLGYIKTRKKRAAA